MEDAQTHIIGDVFKMAFYEKYFSASVRNAKELQFMRLQQVVMTITKYMAKFKELRKFSTIYQRNPY